MTEDNRNQVFGTSKVLIGLNFLGCDYIYLKAELFHSLAGKLNKLIKLNYISRAVILYTRFEWHQIRHFSKFPILKKYSNDTKIMNLTTINTTSFLVLYSKLAHRAKMENLYNLAQGNFKV